MDEPHDRVSTQGGTFGAFRVPSKKIDPSIPLLLSITIAARILETLITTHVNKHALLSKFMLFQNKTKAPDVAPGDQTEHVHPPTNAFSY